MRKVIIDEHAINPKYYDQMSELLDALIEQRRQGALDYKEYLEQLIAQAAAARQARSPTPSTRPGPTTAHAGRSSTSASRATNWPSRSTAPSCTASPISWVGNTMKEKKVKRAIAQGPAR